VRFSYLNKDNVVEKYIAAKAYTDKLTDPFPEFERLAQNKPHPAIDKRYPKTTDGTAASIVRKTGKRIVQQLPTGSVEAEGDDDWLSIVADYIYRTKILPHANDEYDLIQKCWIAIEKSLTFGFCAVYTPFRELDGEFSTDMNVLYWGDIKIQPGKRAGAAMDYTFIRSMYQQDDIKALIDREKELATSAKKRGEKYESSWDSVALNKILDAVVKKDSQGTTPHEKARGVDATGIELVTGFQKGVGAEFISFNVETGEIVRVEKNKDPRGKIPIDWMYGDVDGTNPLGRGIMELIGGLQNLIDSDMQMYQFNRALSLAPPLVKKGTFNKNRIQFVPNHIIDLGADTSASIEALKVDTQALVNYPSLYGLQKSQMLNLVPSPDTSIGTEVGNPGFGKTPTALNQQKASLSVDDNYIRKMFEAFFSSWSETAINRYFAGRQGKEVIKLDDETIEKLKELAQEGKFNLSLINDNDEILLDYDTATPALKFTVDASTSKMQSDQDRMESLTNLLQVLEGNPVLAQTVPQDKLLGVWNSIVMSSGVEDPEELLIDVEEMQQQQAEAMQAQQMAQAPSTPAEAPAEAPVAPEAPQSADDVLIQIMEQSDPQTIANVTDLMNKGYDSETILGALNG
jgi:hypothetical protein